MTFLPVYDRAWSSDDYATALSSDRRPAWGTSHRPFRLLFLLTSWLLTIPSPVWADGGLVRLSEKVGGYRITVLTSPTPFRAGPVEIGVLVQEADSDRTIADANVSVEMSRRDDPAGALRGDATTTTLIPAVNFDLSQGGWWRIRVFVAGRFGPAETTLELEADDPLPPWRELSLWIFLPVIPIGFFVVHQWLIRRRDRAGIQ